MNTQVMILTAGYNRIVELLYRRVCVNTLLVRRFVRGRVNAVAVRHIKWLLAIPAVQYVIAEQFEGGTPLCRALHNAVEAEVDTQIDRVEVDVDQVRNLDRYLSDELDNFARDADKIDGLDRYISSAIDDYMEQELDVDPIVEQVLRVLSERLKGG